MILEPSIIEPRSSLLLTCGSVTEQQAGYNSQVIDIQTICVMTWDSQYVTLHLMVNFRWEAPSLPCAENNSPALLSEMMRKKLRPVQCLGHGDCCLGLVICKGAVLWDAPCKWNIINLSHLFQMSHWHLAFEAVPLRGCRCVSAVSGPWVPQI